MKSIAVCSNGAVALGAYEAGVIAQLYADVNELNESGVPIAIDVVAGASAGAVTCAILVQGLAANLPPADVTKALSNVWIDGLDLVKLIDDPSNPSHSLFSPDYLTKLGADQLLGDAEMAARDRTNANKIAFWIAMTNVDGMPHELVTKNATVIASRFRDYEPILLIDGVPHIAPPVESLDGKAPSTAPIPTSWERVKKLVVTSAAYPFAFKSQVIDRPIANYPDAVVPPGQTSLNFNMVDGGVMNNNPIGRAIDAAAFLDPNANPTYLIIEPDPQTVGRAIAALDDTTRLASDARGLPFGSLIGKIINGYFNDDLYRDLDTALKTNKQIKAFEVQIAGLDPRVQEEIRRAVGLNYKKFIEIERIPSVPRTEPLAGAFYSHFGGFFHRSFRAYDFAVGAYEARQWMLSWSSAPLASNLQSGLPASAPPTPPKAGIAAIPRNELNLIKDKLAERLSVLAIREANLEKGVFAGLGRWLVKKLVRRALDVKLK